MSDDDARNARLRLAGAGAAVVAVLTLTVGLLALFGRSGPQPPQSQPASPSPKGAPTTPRRSTTPTPSDGQTTTAADLAALTKPPATTDPVAFARAYTTSLLSFDTRHETYAQRRARLWAWVPTQYRDSDAKSMLDDFLGGAATWDALAQVHGSQTIVIGRAWIPDSIRAARTNYAAKYAAAGGVWGVTLTVTRQLRGDPGANADLGLTLTVLVHCLDGHTCTAYAPGRTAVEN